MTAGKSLPRPPSLRVALVGPQGYARAASLLLRALRGARIPGDYQDNPHPHH